MAPSRFPDVYSWIQNLPPLSQWKTTSISTPIYSSSLTNSSLDVVVTKSLHSPTITLSVIADCNLIPISLWTSEPLKTITKSSNLVDNQKSISSLLLNFVRDVLHYGSNQQKDFSFSFLKLDITFDLKEIFNLAFLTLVLLICIYEAPTCLRLNCLATLKYHLANCWSRQTSKVLMKLLGSNLEEQWMRSINLAITNWILELKANCCTLKTPSPLFSYSLSTHGLWKVQLYCPVIAMDHIENSSNLSTDERLQFSLNYHQLEGALQFSYKAEVHEKWIDLRVHVDNIRCNIIQLVNDTLMTKRGFGRSEKHFPSRISLQITPITLQRNIISASVSKSSDNPTMEGQNPYPDRKLAIEGIAPWKFEQRVYGNTGILNWYHHNTWDGKEVTLRKPSRFAVIKPRGWFRHRYSSAFRALNKEGGMVIAGDDNGERISWKIEREGRGKNMEWEIRGWIWLTYWPSKYKTFYRETRRFEFKEIVRFSIP